MTRRENVVYVILVLFIALLFADRYMKYGIVFLALAFLMISGKKLFVYKNAMLLVLASIGILAAVHIVFGGMFLDIFGSGYAMKEIYRAIIYGVIMELMLVMTIDIKTYSRVWRTLLIFIVFVAVIQYTKVIDVDSILKSIYGDSVQFYNSAQTDISKFRCGSVFVNPNVFACFLTAMLGSYMFILRYKNETLFMKIVTFGLLVAGFVLSGSRTGFALGIIIIVAYICMSADGNVAEIAKRLSLTLVGAGAILFILVFFFHIDLTDFSALRLFKIEEGMSDSLGTKIGIFTNLLKNMNAGNILFGYGPFNYASSSSLLVDFDFGYFITFFGLCGAIIYIAFLRAIHTWGDRGLYGRRFLNMIFLLIAIIFGFTAGVYFNLRIFSIYMLMFMPIICIDDEVIA